MALWIMFRISQQVVQKINTMSLGFDVLLSCSRISVHFNVNVHKAWYVRRFFVPFINDNV